jgi:hypothetical protein
VGIASQLGRHDRGVYYCFQLQMISQALIRCLQISWTGAKMRSPSVPTRYLGHLFCHGITCNHVKRSPVTFYVNLDPEAERICRSTKPP